MGQADKKERIALFYCSKKRPGPPLEILRSYVAQLALSLDGLSVGESVKRLVDGPMTSELSSEQCSKRLVALVIPYRRVTLLVDALDECESYGELGGPRSYHSC